MGCRAREGSPRQLGSLGAVTLVHPLRCGQCGAGGRGKSYADTADRPTTSSPCPYGGHIAHTCHLRISTPCPKCGGTFATCRNGKIAVDPGVRNNPSFGYVKNNRDLKGHLAAYQDELDRDHPDMKMRARIVD